MTCQAWFECNTFARYLYLTINILSVATHGHEPSGNEIEKGGNTHNDVKIKLHTFGISFLQSWC